MKSKYFRLFCLLYHQSKPCKGFTSKHTCQSVTKRDYSKERAHVLFVYSCLISLADCWVLDTSTFFHNSTRLNIKCFIKTSEACFMKGKGDILFYGKLSIMTEAAQKQQHIIHLLSVNNTSNMLHQQETTSGVLLLLWWQICENSCRQPSACSQRPGRADRASHH